MNSFLAQLNARRILWRKSDKPNELWLCHGQGCIENGEHTPDTRFRLGVNLKDGRAHCFNCEWKSRGHYTFHALSKLFRMSFEDVAYFAEAEETECEEKQFTLPKEFELLGDGSNLDEEFVREAWHYLTEERKLSAEQIVKKRVGYAITGRYAYRVLFPVWNVESELVGIVARSWCDAEPKYLNSMSEAGFERTFYNAHKLKPKKNRHSRNGYEAGETVVITEGLFDALAVEKSYRHCIALASFGALTENQARLLDGFRDVIVFADFDEPGLREAIKACELLDWPYRRVRLTLSDDAKLSDAASLHEAGKQKEIERLVTGSARLYDAWQVQSIRTRLEQERFA